MSDGPGLHQVHGTQHFLRWQHVFLFAVSGAYLRYGNSKEAIKGFIMSRPRDGIPGRRSMPQFNFSDAELDALADFLKYVSEIDTAGWPPNIQG
jgi:nitric oxide reductase subunit C